MAGAAEIALSPAAARRSDLAAVVAAERRRRPGPTVAAVRLTQFRSLMADEFGPVRAASLARDHVLADLGGRTVEDALEAGVDPREAWRAVCDAFDVPPSRR